MWYTTRALCGNSVACSNAGMCGEPLFVGCSCVFGSHFSVTSFDGCHMLSSSLLLVSCFFYFLSSLENRTFVRKIILPEGALPVNIKPQKKDDECRLFFIQDRGRYRHNRRAPSLERNIKKPTNIAV